MSLTAPPWDITVNVGRDGELIFNNTGHNRLALSKIRDLDEIPVLVVVRHREWQELRERIADAESRSDVPPDARDKLEHPDLPSIGPASETSGTTS